jgi:hypothetical protein
LTSILYLFSFHRELLGSFFYRFYLLNEGILTNIDAIARQIHHAPPNLIKQHLQQIINALEQEGNESDPHYLHVAATVMQDILPVIQRNPMFKQEADMLQALASTYL